MTSHHTRHLIRHRILPLFLGLSATLLASGDIVAAEATVEQDWFQVEVTVFTNEDGSAETELWTPNKLGLGFPQRLRTLKKSSDVLQLSDWTSLTGTSETMLSNAVVTPAVVGPLPFAPGDSFKLPDYARESFLALPPADYDFVSTNRALTQSADHRILYHNAWRQPMTRRNVATAVAVTGGGEFDDRFELEGSLALYYNNGGDRVIFAPNLWLTSFTTDDNATEEWQLPVLPGILQPVVNEPATQEYFVGRIIRFNQTREMRSDEFHYLDHPAMGVLIQITPYSVPPLPTSETETEVELEVPDPALQSDGVSRVES